MLLRAVSTGLFVIMAACYLIAKSDRNKRPEVSISKWFGLSLSAEALFSTLWVLMINTMLFAGEVWQMARGYVAIMF